MVSEYVRARDKKCVVCGSEERLTNGHLFSRTAYSTRWDLRNCFTQCWPCNYSHEFNPGPYTSWYLDTFGQDAYRQLHKDYGTTKKFKDFDLLELIEDYTVKLKALTG